MNLLELLVISAAFLNLLAEARDTYRRLKNYEPEEMHFLRREMLKNGAEAERLRLDRDKWVKEVGAAFDRISDLEKKIAHLRRQIPDVKLSEIDESWHGERP